MSKTAKRPSKAAKAAKKILAGSDLLTKKKDSNTKATAEVERSSAEPRTSSGVKPRPDKKRG